MTVIPPDLLQALHAAGGSPIRLTDPETNLEYIVVRAELFQRVSQLFEDPRETYPAVDEAWKEGWDHPLMADYDRYEDHKP